MFERFTDEARRVIVSGQEAARQRGHVAIGTEHVLLGLVGEEECDGARRPCSGSRSPRPRCACRSTSWSGAGTVPSATPTPSRSRRRPRRSSSCRHEKRSASDTERSAPSTCCWGSCGSETASPAGCSSSWAPICPAPERPSWRWRTSSVLAANASAPRHRSRSMPRKVTPTNRRPAPVPISSTGTTPPRSARRRRSLRADVPARHNAPPPDRPARLLARAGHRR